MKRFFVAAVAVASLFGSAAMAADLPVKAAPMPAAVYNWTGFYIGGNIGYSWGRSSDFSTLTNGAGTVLFSNSNSTDLNGFVGGGQIGYNWQVTNWVWGLEADIQGTDEKGSRNFTCGTSVCRPDIIGALVVLGPPVLVSPMDQKIEWFGTVRGRAGILATPAVLLYGTGGLAYGDVRTAETVGGLAFTNTQTRVGWTVGAGVEGAIGGNWTAKLEYLYVDLGRTTGSFLTTFGAVGGGVLSSNYSSRITDNVLRVGVNYRFGGPVVAKY
jgi:outer membrane immunogenic protein